MSTVSVDRTLGLRRVIVSGILVSGAAVLLATLISAAGSQRLGYDFRTTYLPAAEAVRSGGSPLTDPASPLVDEGQAYAYPPLLAVLLVPFTVVSADTASFVAFLASLAALLGTLAVLGVRDVRCYAAFLVWAPAFNALEMANVSAALALLTALAWRYRDKCWRLTACLAFAVATKLFPWPLVVWALATRRFLAAALSVAMSVVVVSASWAVVGFAGVSTFPDLLEATGNRESYSLAGTAASLGYGWTAGHLLAAAAGGVLLVACVRRGRDGDDMRAFVYAIAASLALTPILWQHYLVVLVVPLALARPRFSALWLVPIVLWVSPRAGSPDRLELFLPAVVTAVVLLAVLRNAPVRVRTSVPAR